MQLKASAGKRGTGSKGGRNCNRRKARVKCFTLSSTNSSSLIDSSSYKTHCQKLKQTYIIIECDLKSWWSELWIVLTDNVWITSGPIESKDFVTSSNSLTAPWYTTCPCFEILQKKDINKVTSWSEYYKLFLSHRFFCYLFHTYSWLIKLTQLSWATCSLMNRLNIVPSQVRTRTATSSLWGRLSKSAVQKIYNT